MPKTLATIYSRGYADYKQFAPITFPAMVDYGARHGYDVSVYNPDPALPVPGWGKLPALIDALGSSEIALWVDADLLIQDPRLDVADVLPPGAMQAMTHDTRHRPPVTICFWLVTRAALPFLHAVWELHTLPHHPNGETYAVHRVLARTPYWLRHTHVLSDDWLDDSNGYAGGTRLLHADYNTGSIAERVTVLRAAAAPGRSSSGASG